MGTRTGNPTWVNSPSTSTPISAAALNNIETAIDKAVVSVNGTAPDSAGNVAVSTGLPAGSVMYTTSTTRPTARTDIMVIFIGSTDPGSNAIAGLDEWRYTG